MKRVLYCLSFFLLLGCRRVADFDFDTQTQSLTINDGYFYDICFENDSVTSDGKLSFIANLGRFYMRSSKKN